MYVDKTDLLGYLDSQGLRNFFRTYGFFVVKDYYTPEEFKAANEAYKKVYETHFGRAWQNLMSSRPGQMFQPNFIDSSPVLTEIVLSDLTLDIVEYLAGGDYLYLGSDGSCFVETSFHWHRDWFTVMPQIKINSYFNYVDYQGGRFLIIPGSQNPSDFYTHSIGAGLAWPFGQTSTGGLNERSFFPFTSSPRERFSKPTPPRSFMTPHVALEICERDIVIFDQRALHCVEEVQPMTPRMLCTALFCSRGNTLFSDPFYDEYFALIASLNHSAPTPESVDLEVSTLFWAERDQIGCQAYGNTIPLHKRIYPNHIVCNPAEITSFYPFNSSTVSAHFSSHIDSIAHPVYEKELSMLKESNIFYRMLNLGLSLTNTSRFARTR